MHTTPFSGIRVNAPAATLIAVCAIGVGVATYAFARAHAAAFLPSGWHRPLAHSLPAWLLAGLPTFVHGLAMPLLIAVAIDTRRERTLQAICIGWAGVEIVCEAMQHAALRDVLLSTTALQTSTTGVLAALANHLRSATFDPMDIAAALLAGWAAYTVLIRSRVTSSDPMEADHVKA